jgi:hypothetical protein
MADNNGKSIRVKLNPAGDPDDELEPDEVIAEANEAMKDRWISILLQLSNSQRFATFVSSNFDIIDQIDDETKTIETYVIEKPTSVGPPLTMNQLWQLRKAIQFSGAKHVNSLFRDVMAVLGQTPPDVIATATDADVTAAIEQYSRKKKLDA